MKKKPVLLLIFLVLWCFLGTACSSNNDTPKETDVVNFYDDYVTLNDTRDTLSDKYGRFLRDDLLYNDNDESPLSINFDDSDNVVGIETTGDDTSAKFLLCEISVGDSLDDVASKLSTNVKDIGNNTRMALYFDEEGLCSFGTDMYVPDNYEYFTGDDNPIVKYQDHLTFEQEVLFNLKTDEDYEKSLKDRSYALVIDIQDGTVTYLAIHDIPYTVNEVKSQYKID